VTIVSTICVMFPILKGQWGLQNKLQGRAVAFHFDGSERTSNVMEGNDELYICEQRLLDHGLPIAITLVFAYRQRPKCMRRLVLVTHET